MHKLRMFEKKVLTWILGSNKDEEEKDGKKLHNEKLYNHPHQMLLRWLNKGGWDRQDM
jgi:ABC-type nitrate/sulfonate/bicarbonate transport system substrate-binding protein